jgi:transposase
VERGAEPGPPISFSQAVSVLDTMPGVDRRGAEVLVAEWGTDMARFGTASRLAAWTGVAPGNDESAGKQRSGKTRKGNRVLRTALTQLAHAAACTKGTYLSALYQRLAARRGKKRAIIAVAHAMGEASRLSPCRRTATARSIPPGPEVLSVSISASV